MKQRFKNFIGGLEKTLESCKRHWKEIVTAVALPFIFENSVKASGLYIQCKSGVNTPVLYIKHITGATEDYDTAYDAVYLQGPSPRICFYSRTLSPPPEDRLMVDSRPAESMSTITSEIAGIDLLSPINARVDNLIFYPSGENNFSWKNIIGELSQRVDDGEGGYKYALIGNYDIKNLVNSATTIPISINNGETIGDEFFPSHKLDYNFFHYTDFNRDTLINSLDFAIFRENWGRTGIVKGSNPNDANDYADISDIYDESGNLVSYGNGTVDFDDLNIFKTYFRFSGDLNEDGKVDNADFAYFAADWKATDVNSIADISGPNGVPDRNVDCWDLSAFSNYYLMDINEPGTWTRVR
jgi:hypothetical protein